MQSVRSGRFNCKEHRGNRTVQRFLLIRTEARDRFAGRPWNPPADGDSDLLERDEAGEGGNRMLTVFFTNKRAGTGVESD